MPSIDLLLTFRGIDVPTTRMMGEEACGLRLRPIGEGREQGGDQVLFAYREGVVWKTALVDVEPGPYRVTLISNDLRCAQDVAIDGSVISERVLRVEFNREDCRRQWVPAAVRQLWWKLCESLEKRREDPRRDRRVLASYRRRFRRGPVGSWFSCHERLTVYGTSVEFRDDFTGTVRTWGDEEEGAESAHDFRWECVGDFAIDVQPEERGLAAEDWGRIEYDFRVTRSPHGTRQVLMYSKDEPQLHPEEPGFWWSSHGVILAEKDG